MGPKSSQTLNRCSEAKKKHKEKKKNNNNNERKPKSNVQAWGVERIKEKKDEKLKKEN